MFSWPRNLILDSVKNVKTKYLIYAKKYLPKLNKKEKHIILNQNIVHFTRNLKYTILKLIDYILL